MTFVFTEGHKVYIYLFTWVISNFVVLALGGSWTGLTRRANWLVSASTNGVTSAGRFDLVASSSIAGHVELGSLAELGKVLLPDRATFNVTSQDLGLLVIGGDISRKDRGVLTLDRGIVTV